MRKRIEYEATSAEPYAQVLNLLAEYSKAVQAEDWADAVGIAHRIEHLSGRLTDSTIGHAADVLPRREIAVAAGVTHGTVNNRLARAQGQQSTQEDIPMSKKDANAEYRAAKAELERISKRDGRESDDYLAANQRVIAAEKHVSWWKK